MYQTRTSPADVAATYRAALDAHGWRRSPSSGPTQYRLASEQWTRHDVTIDLSVPGPLARHYPPDVPSDLTKVEMWIKSR